METVKTIACLVSAIMVGSGLYVIYLAGQRRRK